MKGRALLLTHLASANRPMCLTKGRTTSVLKQPNREGRVTETVEKSVLSKQSLDSADRGHGMGRTCLRITVLERQQM